MNNTIRIGTRGSALAMKQAQWVEAKLRERNVPVELLIISTIGDRITDRLFTPQDGTGVFVTEIEKALLANEIDIAVHSMKDLPGIMTDGLQLAAIPQREDPRDVLCTSNAQSITSLPSQTIIGTSSLRRRAQLLAIRKDITFSDLRGTIDTRLKKLALGECLAICLAAAGLHRLGLAAEISEYLAIKQMIPAAGQGALAIQTRSDNFALNQLLAPLHHLPTARAVQVERAVLAALGGGCSIPLGIHATSDENSLYCIAAITSSDGQKSCRVERSSDKSPDDFGKQIATALLSLTSAEGIII